MTAELLEVAAAAAREGGRVLLERFARVRTIQFKGERDLVTDGDRAAEAAIIAHLRAAFPDHRILSEEAGSLDGAGEILWVIDPLDGTTNFAHGLPCFSVSIGCLREDELLCGAVYDPTRDDLFTAVPGRGARRNGEPLRVSDTAELSQGLLATGFPYAILRRPDNNLDHHANFSLAARAVRRIGSAALDLCYVAAGWFDGYWELSTGAWDVAAGVLIVREAGGTVTDAWGQPIRLGLAPTSILASNGRLHAAMLEVLHRGKLPARPAPR
jgi:myo-inositol-1(or 4)-monophosphatase